MKIDVCVKQVPASNETRLDPVTHTIIRDSSAAILNPFDAYAVEEALLLRERCGGTVKAFSMGIPAAADILRRVLALGVDDALLLTDSAFAGSDTLATSRVLAAAIAADGLPDLILCGRIATDGDTAQVGPMLAECLGIPHVSDVAAVEELSEKAAVVRRLTDYGYARIRVKLPALLTVLKEINNPRLPSLTGILRAENKPVPTADHSILGIDPAGTGLAGSSTRVVSSFRPVLDKKSEILSGTPEQQAGQFLDRLNAADGTGARRKVEAVLPETPPHAVPASSGSIWVFCEPSPDGIHPVAFELLGEASRLSAGLHCSVTALLPGGCEEFAPKLAAGGADAVILIENADAAQPDELQYTSDLAGLIRKYDPAVLLIGATAFGRSMAPRLAARLGTGLTADCTALSADPDTGLLKQTRPAFGGNLMATIICPDHRPQMATVRPKVFPVPASDPDRPWQLIREKSTAAPYVPEWLERIASAEDMDIGKADILVAVGQGIGGAENLALAEKLARKLHGALASSRPLVDNGVMPYPRQVGQTGKTVAPRLYLALGISGAIQHMAGIAAQKLVAVNTDPDAPICGYADEVIPCDCGAFLRAVLDLLA